jgi:TonB family protein
LYRGDHLAVEEKDLPMKLKLAAVLVIAMLGPVAHAQEVARELPAQVALDVHPDGQVAHVQWPAEFPALLAKPASEVMMHWRFKPIERHGQPASAQTYARIKVQLVKRGAESYGVQVRYLSNGPRIRPTVAPYYPLSETSNGQAEMLVQAVVQPDGTLGDVQIVEAYFRGTRSVLFRKSVTDAVTRWRADPELVDGRPVATRIQIPMSFLLTENGRSWSPPKLKLLRQTAATAAAMPAPIGEAVAMDSPLEPAAVNPGG